MTLHRAVEDNKENKTVLRLKVDRCKNVYHTCHLAKLSLQIPLSTAICNVER
jgi:hypothetical protein